MKGGNARHILCGLAVAGALFLAPRFASAATMFLSPSGGTFGVGRVFPVTVRVNTQGIAVNAAEGTLSFNPAVLQVVSLTTNGSIFNLNVQEPDFNNTTGTIRWAGVILNPGFTGTSGNLLTINFRGATAGTGTVNVASAAVLANDGRGTNVLAGSSGGTYTIGPTTAAPAADSPKVTSTTHPDPVRWYNNNDPELKWELPTGIDGVSYLINAKADANPGNQSDGLRSSVQFTDIPDGATFFHIKFRRGGVWGPITHFALNIDTVPPEPFTITRTDADDTTNPQPKLTFVARDVTSGVARYMMRIDNGEWFSVEEAPAYKVYVMPPQEPGVHEVTVEAFDAADNGTRATLTVTVESAVVAQPGFLQWLWDTIRTADWFAWLGWILIMLILLIVADLLWHRLHRVPIIVPLKREEKKEVGKLREIADDIEAELVLLTRVSKYRPLYPEEKYLRSKLMQYRKDIKFLLTDTHSRLAKKK